MANHRVAHKRFYNVVVTFGSIDFDIVERIVDAMRERLRFNGDSSFSFSNRKPVGYWLEGFKSREAASNMAKRIRALGYSREQIASVKVR